MSTLERKLRNRSRLIALAPRLFEWREHLRFARETYGWRKTGWPTALPGFFKRTMLLAEARRIGAVNFVETGTYLGDTVWFMREHLRRIISIEVEPTLARAARDRFRPHPSIQILTGDSATVLPTILSSLEGPTLFWLDGHFSGDITGSGQSHCPLLAEVTTVCAECPTPWSIYVDDMRYMGVDPAYPTAEALTAIVRSHRDAHDVRAENDVLQFRLQGQRGERRG